MSETADKLAALTTEAETQIKARIERAQLTFEKAGAKILEGALMLAREAGTYTPSPDADVMRYCADMADGSFLATLIDNDQLGVGFYPTLPLHNHFCLTGVVLPETSAFTQTKFRTGDGEYELGLLAKHYVRMTAAGALEGTPYVAAVKALGQLLELTTEQVDSVATNVVGVDGRLDALDALL